MGYGLLVSVIVNVVLAVIIFNLLTQVETLEEHLTRALDMLSEIDLGIQSAIRGMRAVDDRGAFESTDDVGAIFKTLLGMVVALSTFSVEIVDEEN